MNNSIDLKTLIGEATEYDKKQAVEIKKPKSWCKSVSAFANGSGGALIFGIADDGEIVGLDNPDSDAETISEIIKSRLDPIPEFNLRFEQVDNRTVIILDIMSGDDTPYYYSADGVLGKILDAYEFQVNYKEDKKPSFRSDRASFFAIMPNLNYLSDNVAHDVAQTLAEIIVEEIHKNNKVTREQIAGIANVSKKTVERELKKMNNVRYVGSGSNGHWEIID